MPPTLNTICVIGAGTMGSGIAQITAQHGFYTLLYDIKEQVLEKAKDTILKNLQLGVEKQKLTEEEMKRTFNRIRFINDTNDCLADLVIEAIIEKTEAKISIFNQLAEVNHAEVIFASNTSSLSISKIQAGVVNPQRVAGMHFFNPPQLMKLVEVVKGDQTSEETVQAIYQLCLQMNKAPVMCKDAPGFIVNRVARPYYLEALKLVENGIATVETVDTIMESCGFKMGPFKLMDLIGMDINLAVSTSLYEAFNQEERFKPSSIQVGMVERGELGRKTGRGFYAYE